MIGPRRGEVWFTDLNPTRGHEQAGRRPVLVISIDAFNTGPADLVLVLPITSNQRGVLYHVSVTPPECGLAKPSDILCDAIRSIAKERLARRLGAISAATMAAVEERLRIIQGL
ncbi:MAG: type II toxin-antitoxin system PemK/MazF family toxin [Armatimonadetes bacterium]|nr:type II toxin-antitoxin system PemK/MazF family toxin [Armatimonadota bacterium]